MLGSGAIIVVDETVPIVVGRAAAGRVLPARVLRQVRSLPRGHQLDREDARAHRPRRGDADGPRRDGERPGEHHRQLPVRARRLDGDAGRLDDQQFRAEFEEHIEQAGPFAKRTAQGWRRRAASAAREDGRRADGAEPTATGSPSASTAARCARPRTSGCVDAVKRGDVEVPFFCYEPKLGQPVGACRMCLVEIEGMPEAADLVLDAGQGRHGRLHADRPRQARAERGRRVPARQPPARLPGLRQGRRVPAAGHLLRLGTRHEPLRRAEAQLPEADRAVAAGRDRPRALHPLLPLRALLAGGRRGLPAGLPRARATTPSSAPSTAGPTWRRSRATSSSCAPSAR